MVRKSIVSFVVLHNENEDLNAMSLQTIIDECDEGSLIRGSKEVRNVGDLTGDALHTELLAIGNDGTFFDHEIDE